MGIMVAIVMGGYLLFGKSQESMSTFIDSFNLRIFEIFQSGISVAGFRQTDRYFYVGYSIFSTFVFNWCVVQMVVCIALDTYMKMQVKYQRILNANIKMNQEKSLAITKKWIDFFLCRGLESNQTTLVNLCAGMVKNFKNLKVL